MKTIEKLVKVLIIDDAYDTREIMSLILQKKGFDVQAVGNSMDALAIAARNKPDIIIYNITSSETDAFETGRRIREVPEARDTPIIFLSACHDLSGNLYELSGARILFVEKPCSIRYLIKQANKLIAFSRKSPPATE